MHNNKRITNPKSTADGFNNYFVNIGPTLASEKKLITISHIGNFYLRAQSLHYS